MKNQNQTGFRGRRDTLPKYTQTIHRIIAYMAANGGKASAREVYDIIQNQPYSEGSATASITTYMKDFGLVYSAQDELNGKKKNTKSYYLTPLALSGDYNLREIIVQARANKSKKDKEAIRERKAQEAKEQFQKMDIKPATPPTLGTAKPIQLELLVDPSQAIKINGQLMTWEQWFNEAKRQGYIIAKTV